jgi:lysophospholipase L1-like esterase
MSRRAIVTAVTLGLAVIAVAAAAVAATATSEKPLHLVVLGDSTAQASACPGCTDYAHLYAKDIENATGQRVRVDNRGAFRNGVLPMAQLSQTLAGVYADHSLRRALAEADVVVIGLGFNDTAWNRFDNPCEAAPEYPVIRWDEISDACQQQVTHEFKQTLDILLTQINQLRSGRPTLLRVVTPYDNVIGDTGDPGWDTPEGRRVARRGNDLLSAAQCEDVGFHGGACADLHRAFNGADGTSSPQAFLADGTHMNQAGHQRTAELLAGLGYAPLVP